LALVAVPISIMSAANDAKRNPNLRIFASLTLSKKFKFPVAAMTFGHDRHRA
jgi:hypothetical protein